MFCLFYLGATEGNRVGRTERQTDLEEINPGTHCFVRVLMFGQWVRDDRKEWWREPLGGCRNGTDSPCIKLIIENTGKLYYCGCRWGLEKINRLFQGECQRRNAEACERNISGEREAMDNELKTEYSSMTSNHYAHNTCTLNFIMKNPKSGCFVQLVLAASQQEHGEIKYSNRCGKQLQSKEGKMLLRTTSADGTLISSWVC